MKAAQSAKDVLASWFGPGRDKQWFAKDETFDAEVRQALGPLAAEALTGALDPWAKEAEGALALILLLDQAPRNLHRGQAAAFAGDERARQILFSALRAGHDLGLSKWQRLFLYLPLEHSESLNDQFLSVALIGALGDSELTRYALAHQNIVERFGRFPHRNVALMRITSKVESEFLAGPNSSF